MRVRKFPTKAEHTSVASGVKSGITTNSTRMPSTTYGNAVYEGRNRVGGGGGGGGDDEVDNARETTSFHPVTATILQTLSQDNLFSTCFVLAQILGLVTTVLCFLWMKSLGGFGVDKPYFGFNDPHLVFNWHPFLMTLGMVFLNANGILIYRSATIFRYKNQKLLHFGIQTSAIAISWIGFFSAFRSHTLKNIPHFYSLHSWLGLTALGGVTISLVTSFMTFLYPRANSIYRKLSMPFHVFGGIANIALSAGICVTGITEKAIFSMNNKKDKAEHYANLPSTAVLLNCFGLVMVTFTILVVWMVTKPEFKRRTQNQRGAYYHDKSYD